MSLLADDIAFLLDEHGYDVTVSRESDESYNPETGEFESTTLTGTIRGVFINYEQDYINNTTILADDRKLLIQAKGIEMVPKMGDVLDGDVQIVGPVRKIQSGDTVIAYTAQTRG